MRTSDLLPENEYKTAATRTPRASVEREKRIVTVEDACAAITKPKRKRARPAKPAN
jgi:hypothetical protein